MGADGLEPALARYERVVLTFELHPLKNPDRDLNPDKENQKLLCYHYTIGVNSTRLESNQDNPLRRRVFYPLNYGS